MTGQKFLPLLAALALLPGGAARATLPPPPPPEYGAYGPLSICEGELSIAVRPDEAVHVVGSIFRVIGDHGVIAATPVVLPHLALSTGGGVARHGVFALKDMTLAFRYSGELPDGAARDAVHAREGFGEGGVRYAVQTRGNAASPDGMMAMLIVGSPAFDGSAADKAILERFRTNAAGASGCVRPADLARGTLDPGAAGFVQSFDNPYYAGLYPAAPDEGPGFHCAGGVGFAFHAGERLRRPWKSLTAGASYLMRGEAMVTLSGPQAPMQRSDPGDAREHPAGLLHETGLTFYPSRGVGPPYAPPGVREDGSWLVELGREKRSRLEIRFAAGDKAPLGFAVIERLEFVAPGDPRCGAPRH
ncbi:hypothetical protein [Sphingopyxis sp.]|jgi:hypothetical protein|uniref:hypothetical protein n=1 Tax=Sphingopyxis sp. TaxID=1908224 RepID=UPI003F6E59F4